MDQEIVNYFNEQPSFDDVSQEAVSDSPAQDEFPTGVLVPSEDGESWTVSSGEPEPEPVGDTTPDLTALQAELEQIRQERDQYATRMGAVEVERQQIATQQAQQQWDQMKAQAVAYAKTLDYDDAINYMAWFDDQRNEAVRQNAQNLVYQANAASYADQIIKQFNLNDEDRILLGTDTRNFPVIAERLRKERDEMDRRFAEMQKQVKNTRLSSQASQRLASNADRLGPVGRSVPTDWTKLSSEDQLRAMWGLPLRHD
jgi:hypothetical protein